MPGLPGTYDIDPDGVERVLRATHVPAGELLAKHEEMVGAIVEAGDAADGLRETTAALSEAVAWLDDTGDRVRDTIDVAMVSVSAAVSLYIAGDQTMAQDTVRGMAAVEVPLGGLTGGG